MRYMRWLFDSTGPIFNLKFSHYAVSDLELFAEYVRAPYDRPCLNLNNSKRGRPTPYFFADLVQCYDLYEKLV